MADPNGLSIFAVHERAGRPPGVFLIAACVTFVAACAGAPSQTQTEPPRTKGELLRAGAIALDEPDLQRLMKGARVRVVPPDGVGRVWVNRENGTLSATRDRREVWSANGTGTWRLDGNTYCVHVNWQTGAQSWVERNCGFVYRLGERLYGVSTQATDVSPITMLYVRPR